MSEQSASSKICPDCGDILQDIMLFGRGPQNPINGNALDAALTFYATDAKRDFWWGMLKETGTVQAYKCFSCHRIFLYGTPSETA